MSFCMNALGVALPARLGGVRRRAPAAPPPAVSLLSTFEAGFRRSADLGLSTGALARRSGAPRAAAPRRLKRPYAWLARGRLPRLRLRVLVSAAAPSRACLRPAAVAARRRPAASHAARQASACARALGLS